MKKIILFSLLFICLEVNAQVPEDALRYSWIPNNGTARNMATGGVMGSLGGDITATFTNPAGIGLFKTNEVVFTPGWLMNRNKINYRDSTNKNQKNKFNQGPMGVILAFNDKYDTKQSAAVSIAFNQTASFGNTYRYSGLNNYSSFSEQFAEEFARNKYSIGQILNSSSPSPFTVSPAFYTNLIDTVRINDSTVVIKGAPETLLDAGFAVRQDVLRKTRGGIYELALAYAHNYNDKWLIGAGMGIPFVYYNSQTDFTESDTSASPTDFSSFTFSDRFTTQGVGVNIRLGVIYRPQEYFRLGFSLQTPTFMSLTDKRSTYLSTTFNNPRDTFSIGSETFSVNQSNENTYQQYSPWKAQISGSYVFREVENVKRQRAFISADVEYVNHRGTKFKSGDDEPSSSEKTYFKQLTRVVKNQYKGAFNFRVGGEVKFNVVMARLGFAYYGNPYKESPVKGRQMLMSGGLGYRNKGFFIDLTYVHRMNRDFEVPYRLDERANTYAVSKNTQGNIVATLGIKF